MKSSGVDRIEFRVGEFGFAGGAPIPVAEIWVNGVDIRVPLIDADRPRLIAWQRRRAEQGESDVFGDWEGPDDFAVGLPLRVVAPPSRHWFGEPDLDYEELRRTAILTCTCGTFGCGGVTTRLVVEETTVTWSDFHHANRGEAIPLDGYRFDRDQYEASFSRLGSR